MVCPHCGSNQSSTAEVCLNCGKAISPLKRTTQQRIIKTVSVMILVGVLVSGIGYFIETISRTYHPVIEHQPTIVSAASSVSGKISSIMVNATIDGNDIVVSKDAVLNARIVRVNDPEGIQNVPILIYVTPHGKLVTAMSISETCRSNDFYLEGNEIHCANCPSYWNMESMEAYACCQKYYPDPIPSTIVADQIRINKNVVQHWRTRI